MEESTKIILLGQQKQITRQNFINLSPLITQDCLKDINFPHWMGQFRPQLEVLHSCFYYLLAVQKNIQSCHSLQFREKCLASLTQYYIRHKMNFQLYEYAYLVGKLLKIPLDKAMHILYFLIYARLASKPYILTLITQKERKIRVDKKRPTTRSSQKSYSIKSKELNSRHITIFSDSTQLEAQTLKKQLKRIMSQQPVLSKKPTKKNENKKFSSSQDQCQGKDEDKYANPLSYRQLVTSRCVNIPVKVSNNANSSVINRLQLRSSNCRSDSGLKVAQVRRQKFNNFFESTKRYKQLLNKNQSKKSIKSQRSTLKFITDKDHKNLFSSINENQSSTFEYFQEIASHVKNTNQNLDQIRYECSHHNRNTMNPCRQSSFVDWEAQINRNSLRPDIHSNKQNQKRSINRKVVLEEDNKLDFLSLQTEKNKELSQKEKELLKMNKTANQTKFFENYVGSITRRNQNAGGDGENIFFFNTTSKGKSKLIKYKQQYRHFLKNQFFEKDKQTS